MSAEIHYTATVEVTRTTYKAEERGRYANDPPKPATREVEPVTRLVIRADTLDNLRKKITQHVALISDC